MVFAHLHKYTYQNCIQTYTVFLLHLMIHIIHILFFIFLSITISLIICIFVYFPTSVRKDTPLKMKFRFFRKIPQRALKNLLK